MSNNKRINASTDLSKHKQQPPTKAPQRLHLCPEISYAPHINYKGQHANLSKKLLKLGILWPHATKVNAAASQMKRNKLQAAKNAWNLGETNQWVDTSLPTDPMSIPQLEAHCSSVDFALRRAVNGTQPSRQTAIDALKLAELLASFSRTLRANLHPNDEDELRVSLHIASLSTDISRCILLHLLRHSCPDLEEPDDPDAYLDQEQTVEVMVLELDRFATNHDFIERHVDQTDATKIQQRAQMFARRLMAHRSIDSAVGLNAASRIIPGHEKLLGALDLIERALAEIRQHDYQAPDIQPLLLGQATAKYYLTNDNSLLRDALFEAARDEGMQPYERVNFWHSAVAFPGTEGADILVAVHEIMNLVFEQPEAAMNHLLAANTRFLVEAIAGVSEELPIEAAKAAGMVAGFGTKREKWNSDRHVWLMPAAMGAMALVDDERGILAIPLPTLGDDRSLEHLIDLHAEEYDESHQLDGLRKHLTKQMRPLTSYLAAATGPVTTFGFGHMKHIPLAALTGDGAILAAKPGVSVLTLRHEHKNPVIPAEVRRRVVVDLDFQQAPTISPIDTEPVQFDSGAIELSDPIVKNIWDALSSGAEELIFFGHGFVDQFRPGHFGLVIRGTEDGADFIPASFFNGGDYRSTQLALIMACGSGQSSVFNSSQRGVAEALSAAGCELVIAPIWPIEATVAADFCSKFLQRVGTGMNPRDAWAEILVEDPNTFCSITCFGSIPMGHETPTDRFSSGTGSELQ